MDEVLQKHFVHVNIRLKRVKNLSPPPRALHLVEPTARPKPPANLADDILRKQRLR